MIAPSASGRIWDEATTPEALELARRFEDRWRKPEHGRRPDPFEFLRGGPDGGGPGLLLALLRADLALRRRGGEAVGIESYRDRHPEIQDEVLVALIYEEFCLREEAGERPEPASCYERFPDLAEPLREVLEIHDLVTASPHSSTHPRGPATADVMFPESGQTIGGFHLVEELGRGSFARVFLARERQLADRLVALKVSRTGSREPQALARLQHTNIVPVHSYRVDSASGLHVLCMPYFGRITLARLLAEPDLRAPRGGGELVATLDRLVEGDPGAAGGGRRAAREALSGRSYPRAVAWWGARMAEALRHAHDRGVLHRDVKPSNILIAADGTPMLLDFNLAREVELDAEAATKLGGTLAYMAPEHIEALIEGRDEGIDHRADLYALGLVLLEMLGTGPYRASSPTESPTSLLDLRRLGPSGPIEGTRRVPALAAVIRRCLSPHPEDRYGSAADLAADLQAVADDAPLRFAREPLPSRAARWLKANLGKLAGLALIAVVAWVVAVARLRAESAAVREESEIRGFMSEGNRSVQGGELKAAAFQYDLAGDRAASRADLGALRLDAIGRRDRALAAVEARDHADAFFERADSLRFALLRFVGDPAAASAEMIAALKPFGVLAEPDWTQGRAVTLLDARRSGRLTEEVDDLLFFWVVAAALAPPGPATGAADRADRDRNAVAYCDAALRFSRDRASWTALRAWWADQSRPVRRPFGPAEGSRQAQAGAYFRRYLLGMLGTDGESALAWLERAAALEPENYWHHFALAFEHARQGDLHAARPHYDASIALRPDLPWAWKNRALLFMALGDWAPALDDLSRALAVCRSPLDEARVRIELGRARQRLGDFPRARADYDAAVAADPTRLIARDARRDQARLEADSGRIDQALALYDALIAADPGDRRSRHGRANLSLRLGGLDSAEGDLGILIADSPEEIRASALADRADARLAAGRPLEAQADALLAAAIRPSSRSSRLLDRANLALGGDLDPWPDSPDAFDDLPHAGPPLRADLKAAADRLGRATPGRSADAGLRIRRAVLLSAALDHETALDEVDRLVADRPKSTEARVARAQIHRRAGQLDRALAGVAEGLILEPEHAALIETRGLIRVQRGEFAPGYADLAVAFERGAASARGRSMAEALDRLGRPAEAAELWARLVDVDPFDVRSHLGLAVARRHLGQWDRSLVSLEDASAAIDPRSPLTGPVALAYAACLPARADRLPRVFALLRRWAQGRWQVLAGSHGPARPNGLSPPDLSRIGPPAPTATR